MNKTLSKALTCTFAFSLLATSFQFPLQAKAANAKIVGMTAKGLSTSGHDAAKAIDGDKTTYWQTPTPYESINSYQRNIDLDLNGLYALSGINLFTQANEYYQYSIYVSEDGYAFNKVAYKSDDTLSNATGDSHTLNNVPARYVRININYKSGAARQVDLNEVEIFGSKTSDTKAPVKEIKTDDFKDSSWGKEFEKVNTNSAYAKQKTIKEASDLVARVIGEQYRDKFVFDIREQADDENDLFTIDNAGTGKIKITGNDGVSLASGFNYYIKNYCNVDYNPLFSSNLKMPVILPSLKTKIAKETQYDLRYALNFCTYSYTMAFWNWDEYEEFIDWAAMNGINLMLDVIGQEEVQRRMLREYGYTDQEIKDYITGPGYFAWFYMQNMGGYGGPLPDNWFENRIELGRKVHDRMQAYGIKPVLEGFAGMVPSDFKDKNPKSKVIDLGNWCGFNRPDSIQTFLLDKDIAAGKEDYYQKVSETFYKVQKDIYGDISPYYAVDPFHEGGNKGDLWGQDTKLYKTIQDSMIKANKDAVWIMQKWGSNANPTQLQDLDKNHVVVLDLYSEMEPHNDEINNTGTPWIWNMLHNFGGRAGMDGQPEVLATVIPKDKQTKNKMVGIGITPEAINNSPMMYELLFDMTWTKDPIDYRAWTSKYIERRYGKTTPEIEKAWDILLDTVYSTKTTRPGQGAPETVVNWKPSMETFSNASTWGHSITAYDIKEFEKAINLFIAAYPDFKDSDAFKYDFIDVTTQAISNSAKTYHKAMSAAYEKANLNEFDRISKQFIDLIKLEDKVLSTNKEFMVGSWINKSRKMLDNADDWTNDLFELNARSLISVWGSSSTDDLLDYSNRQLSGITQDYYLQRWENAIGEFRERIKAGDVSNKKLDSNKYWLMGWKWANQKSDEGHGYSEKANNYDLSQLAQEVYDKHSLASLDKFLSGENVADAKVNVALNKTVTSNKGTDTAFPLTNLTDEKSGTLWKQNSNEWPTELTLDLAGRFSINGISFTMQPIAGGVDLAYKVEVFDEGSWKTVVDQAQSTIIGTINVPYIGEGSKVRYTFNHTGGSLVPTFDEVMVYGVPYEASQTNVARGKTVTLNPNNGPYQLENITDGDVNTIGAGGETEFGKVTPEMILDLNGTFDASNVTVYMEQTANLGFKFRTSVQLEDDSWEVIDDQSANTELGINKFKFDKAVNKKIKKVKVTYISKSNNNANFWPGCAEIEVWSPVELPEEEIEIERPNVALNAVATAERGQENAAFVTDGNLSTFWHYNANEYPGTIKVDLGNQKLIDTARVNFEVPADSPKGRAFKFIINAYDENNNKVFVDDQSNRSGKIPYYDAKINKEVRYIEVSLTGKDLVAEPGAWPAIMEIQAFLPLNNIAKTATVSATPNLDVSLIHDDNNNTGIDVAGTKNIFEFSLDKAQDINAFEIIKGSAEPLKYMIETKENDSDSYATFIDKSKNTNKNNKNVITIGTPKLVKKLRLTILNENYTLNEVRLYEYNAFNKVITQISNIEKNIDKVVIGDKVGNYTQASLDKVKNILTTVRSEIVKAGKLNSKEADAYLETVKNAYLEFKKTGFVSVDRIELFTAIVHAEDVKKFIIAENISDVLDESFDITLAASQAVYDKNDVSQTEIDNATKALNALILSIEAKLPKMEQYKLALTRAEDKLKNSVVGSIEGQYTKESKDALQAVVDDAKKKIQSSTAEQVDELKNKLIAAIDVFDKSVIVVDKTQLNAILALANDYQENEYTKDSWKILQEKITLAKNVIKNQVTQKQYDMALDELQLAIKNIDQLNRNNLKKVIEESNKLVESNYTKDSWKAYSLIKAESLKALSETSINQKDIDDICKKLDLAIKSLVSINTKPNESVDENTLQSLNDFVKQVAGLNMSKYSKNTQTKILKLEKEIANALASGKMSQKEADEYLAQVKELLALINKEEQNTSNPNNPGTITPIKPGSSNNGNGGSNNANTGDSTNTEKLLGMSILSIGLAAAIIKFAKKRKKY